ncbi:MAG TPA: hypothetical protein DCK95_08770 [Anaerolineaceae bacterium]|uniref:YYY membrane protein n=1 Tax=Anaerolinea thermophila TaxID=167964 RepID=A0A101FYE5_9CHLR|nr:MAG: hypothetical protein XD73_0518 [Anaerolinea thermophila]HAF62406.1 hypothetical protein [Anaerolineaceae bacterium]
MVGQIVIWYSIFLVLGWVNFPLTSLIFSSQKNKGFAFSKIIGLLLWGYIYWITNIFNLLTNTLVGVVSALLIVVAINAVVFHRQKETLKQAVTENRKTYVVIEALFLVAFVGTCLTRAMTPNLTGTEKPMELAFINAIIQSPQFPPSDPWLSGYAISYYYFGYLMVAMLAILSGISGGIAFNLAISVWVGMICIASFGILYELLNLYFAHRKPTNRSANMKVVWLALLAPFFLLVVSNAEGGLEMLHATGTFWQPDAEGVQQSDFWEWLDIQELNTPPAESEQWAPQRVGGTWWWRASRVVSDYDGGGNFREVIDEFPAFTFYLADLHPHVLSIPFFLVSIALSLELFLCRGKWIVDGENWKDILRTPQFWISSFILGSLLFMNTWDFPAGFGLFVFVLLLANFKHKRWSWAAFWQVLWKAMLLALSCILLYLPFFLGFASQAGGVLPSLLYSTRGAQFTVMFFPFLGLLLIYLIWTNRRSTAPDKKILRFTLLGFVLLTLFTLLFPLSHQIAMGFWARMQDLFGGFESQLLHAMQQAQSFAMTYNTDNISSLMRETIQRRLHDPSVTILLFIFISLVIRYLFREKGNVSEEEGETENPIHEFVHLLILMGAGLCLIPEFFFLGDVFQTRMNTIFKFYFQAWILWSIAGSFALVVLWDALRGVKATLFKVCMILVLGIACVYPFFLYRDRIRNTDPTAWTLDGTAYLEYSNASDVQVVETLQTLPYGVIVEAVGSSYTGYARIATISGYPTVLGWPGHEMQWRGGVNEMGTRQTDIQTLYETSEWFIAKEIMDRYDIKYVVVGNYEQTTYDVDEQKFSQNLSVLMQTGNTTLYGYP